jgi:hypothetical protein
LNIFLRVLTIGIHPLTSVFMRVAEVLHGRLRGQDQGRSGGNDIEGGLWALNEWLVRFEHGRRNTSWNDGQTRTKQSAR